MKTIIFVCHGNICRSVAAEYIAKNYLRKHNRLNEFNIFSRAVSLEEIGNDIYPPMKKVLDKYNIPYEQHYATQITLQEYENADYVFYMDENNLFYLNRMFPNARKNFVINLSDFLDELCNKIEDPWYTGRFELVYQQISKCVGKLFEYIK